MFEIFFMFTVIFVAYVVYHMFNEQKEAPTNSSNPVVKPLHDVSAVLATKPAVVLAPKTSNQSKKPAAVKAKTKVVKKTPVTTTAKSTDIKKGLRDPKTGEVATTYNNYRFTKRWIKDALVSEGFLEKVYKNNELEPEIEATIKAAIVKLEALEKYKP